MCTKSFFRIKSVSNAGIKYSFLPCGKCFDCRQSLKSQWIFRVRAELSSLTAKGWKIGFFTLTYNDEHLPHIPDVLINGEYREVPCFNKRHIKDFVARMRKWLQKKYNCVKSRKPRVMICSEFGELRHRPHYHGIVCFPPDVDAVAFHRELKRIWYSPSAPDIRGMDDGLGYFGPFNFDGDVDEDGKIGKPFICDSVKASAMYACKYVCKDINFLEAVADVNFFKKRKFYWNEKTFEKVIIEDDSEDCLHSSLFDGVEAYGQALVPSVEYIVRSRSMVELPPYHVEKLSDYFPFHFQSRGMGFSFIEGKSDMQLMDLYKNGYLFDGDAEASELPVYLKNKIIFTPKYVFDADTGKRLVRREVKPFFRDNLLDIFALKVKALSERWTKFLSLDYWKSLEVEKSDLHIIENSIPHVPAEVMAKMSLAYFGVRYDECFNIDLSLQWFRRYDYDYVDVASISLISRSNWSWIQSICHLFYKLDAKYELAQTLRREKDFRIKERISAFHKFKH